MTAPAPMLPLPRCAPRCRHCANRGWQGRWTRCPWACPPTWRRPLPRALPVCASARIFLVPEHPNQEPTVNHKNIAFIGAGNMARAIIQGLLAKGYPATAIRATTSSPASAASAAEALGIDVSADNLAAARWADVVVLAVKPQKL